MHGTPPPSSTLSGICNALALALGETAQNETATLCGCSQSAVSRRADDLHLWPASDLLRLAARRPQLADALLAYLRGNHPQGEAVAAARGLLTEIERGSEVSRQTATALADGKVDEREALSLLRALRDRRSFEDERLIPDLQACATGGSHDG